ncbi:uncharacterized protein LOC100179820 [Ciona intestinalis]
MEVKSYSKTYTYQPKPCLMENTYPKEDSVFTDTAAVRSKNVYYRRYNLRLPSLKESNFQPGYMFSPSAVFKLCEMVGGLACLCMVKFGELYDGQQKIYSMVLYMILSMDFVVLLLTMFVYSILPRKSVPYKLDIIFNAVFGLLIITTTFAAAGCSYFIWTCKEIDLSICLSWELKNNGLNLVLVVLSALVGFFHLGHIVFDSWHDKRKCPPLAFDC